MHTDPEMTLDPPGTIAVVGAGPLGIEAALYGRFLGYDVRLIEAVGIASSWRDQCDEPLSVTPDQSLSSLAKAALEAQRGGDEPLVLPMTVGQWIDHYLVPLVQTDLLRGRMINGRVIRIDTVSSSDESSSEEVMTDQLAEGSGSNLVQSSNVSSEPQRINEADAMEEEPEEDVPPDFRLTLIQQEDQIDAPETSVFEAIILTPSDTSTIDLAVDAEVPYLFRLPSDVANGEATGLIAGRRAIVEIYASLAGRSELDLYRPRRV